MIYFFAYKAKMGAIMSNQETVKYNNGTREKTT